MPLYIQVLSIVRNPYDRLFSDLFYLKIINVNSDPSNVFNQIVKYLYYENFHDNHRTPQYIYLIDIDNKINQNIIIIKNENMNEEIKKLGFNDFNQNDNITHKGKCDYTIFLNNDSIELINIYYKKDFEYFDYKMIEL